MPLSQTKLQLTVVYYSQYTIKTPKLRVAHYTKSFITRVYKVILVILYQANLNF